MIYFGIEVEVVGSKEQFVNLIMQLQNFSQFLIYSDLCNNSKYTPLHREQTISPNNIFDFGFQIKTKKFIYNQQNIQIIKQILYIIYSNVTSNDDCSIHVHVSKDKCSLKYHYAVLYKYLNLKYDKDILTYKGVHLCNETYASYRAARSKYLYSVNSHINNKLGKFFINLDNDSKKYTLYRVSHRYNTIQYRGIRKHIQSLLVEDVLFLIQKFITLIDSIECNNKELKVFRIK